MTSTTPLDAALTALSLAKQIIDGQEPPTGGVRGRKPRPHDSLDEGDDNQPYRGDSELDRIL